MNIVQISESFNAEEITLIQACEMLDNLGYTDQEIRRIIKGAMRAQDINSDKLHDALQEISDIIGDVAELDNNFTKEQALEVDRAVTKICEVAEGALEHRASRERWSNVVRALGTLYEAYNRKFNYNTDEEVDALMEAYDAWLD